MGVGHKGLPGRSGRYLCLMSCGGYSGMNVPETVFSRCTCLTPYEAQLWTATTKWHRNSMPGTHHDRLDTCHLACTPMVGVLWVSKVDFSGNFLVKPKFGAMAEGLPLDQLMTGRVRHSICVLGTRDYPIIVMATCTW